MASEEISNGENILDKVVLEPEEITSQSASEALTSKEKDSTSSESTNNSSSESKSLENSRNEIASGGGYGGYIALFAIVALIGVAIWWYISHSGFFKKKDKKETKKD